MDNARLFDEAQRRAEREALINKIGQALRVTLDMDEILQIVTEQVGQAMKVSRCSWARLNGARDTLEVAPQQYTAPGVPTLTFLYRLADCPPEVVDAWTAGRPVVSHDYTQDAASLAAGIQDLTRAFIACPVFLRGQFSGPVHRPPERRPPRLDAQTRWISSAPSRTSWRWRWKTRGCMRGNTASPTCFRALS